MSPFEFVFSLFGLLLGLSLAEVLGGLARAAQFGLGNAGWDYFPAFAAFVILVLAAMFAGQECEHRGADRVPRALPGVRGARPGAEALVTDLPRFPRRHSIDWKSL
jgi:hypothetical protein